MPSNVINTYEAMFLLPSSAASELEGAMTLCRGIIERHGGSVISFKRWDERKLAYEIGTQKRGVYVIIFFTASGNAITAIERDVKLNDNILRVMVLRADHLNKDEMAAVEPQPIVPREERSYDRPYGDRPDRSFDRGGDRGDRGDRGGDRGDRGGDRPARGRRDEAGEPMGADKD